MRKVPGQSSKIVFFKTVVPVQESLENRHIKNLIAPPNLNRKPNSMRIFPRTLLSIGKKSLKSEGSTSGGSLVSRLIRSSSKVEIAITVWFLTHSRPHLSRLQSYKTGASLINNDKNNLYKLISFK
jgi:hypothetical protein